MLLERIDQWESQIREEGRQEGRQQARAELLLQQLDFKFGTLSPEIEEQVRAADSSRLLEWSTRILRAEHLEDVFGSGRE